MTITKEAVLGVLRKLASDPERRNPECIYYDEHRMPVCVAGHVFADLSPDIFDRIEPDAEQIGHYSEDRLVQVAEVMEEVGYDDAAIELLARVQSYADRAQIRDDAFAALTDAEGNTVYTPWAEAIAKALADGI